MCYKTEHGVVTISLPSFSESIIESTITLSAREGNRCDYIRELGILAYSTRKTSILPVVSVYIVDCVPVVAAVVSVAPVAAEVTMVSAAVVPVPNKRNREIQHPSR